MATDPGGWSGMYKVSLTRRRYLCNNFARSHEPVIHTCSFSLVPMFACLGLGPVLRLVLLVALLQPLLFCALYPSWHFCIFILFKSNLIRCSSRSSAKLPHWPHHIFHMCEQRSGQMQISPGHHVGRGDLLMLVRISNLRSNATFAALLVELAEGLTKAGQVLQRFASKVRGLDDRFGFGRSLQFLLTPHAASS